MAIRHKRKSVADYTWLPADLVDGQVGLNTADGTLHFKKTDNSIVRLDDIGTKVLAQPTAPTNTDYLWLDTSDPAIGIQTRFNRIVVRQESDFGVANAGVIQLADNTLYEINGSVTTTNTLNYGTNSMIRGSHMGVDAIVYVGGLTAITVTNVNFFMNNLVIVAPGGTAINATGTITTEFLWTLVAIVNCATIGTVTGFRVPTFINCNFDTFTNGITFDGTEDKIYLEGCPFRNFTNFGITFATTLSVEVIDISGGYFKESPTGTGIIVENVASVINYGLVRGTVWTNVLTPVSGFGPESVGWDFQINDPIRDSRRVADIFMTANVTPTILIQNVWTKIAGTTTVNKLERFTSPQNNRISYVDNRPGIQGFVAVSLSLLGSSNNQAVEVAIYRNDVIASPPMRTVLTGTSRTDSINVNAILDFNTGDFVEVWVRSTGGNQDVTCENLQFIVTA